MASLLLLSLLIHLTKYTTNGIILRTSCLQYANFSYQKQDAVLQGSVIATLNKKSSSECEAACIDEYLCKSFNTEDEGDKTCELNRASEADKTDNVKVTPKKGWTFKSTNYTELLVGEFCKAFKPCKANELCTDSCFCPGYRCHACKTMELGINCLVNVSITGSALGLQDSSLKNNQLTSKTHNYVQNGPGKARLHGNGGWCATKNDKTQYLQVHFKTRKIITGIAMQGHNIYLHWIKKYQLEYSDDRITWKTYAENGLIKTFIGPSERQEVIKHSLAYYIQAYLVVFRPTEWHTEICARVEVYGVDDYWKPEEPKVAAFGFENKKVLDSQFSASSDLGLTFKPHNARLNNVREWCAGIRNVDQYLRVDFPKRMVITRIDVQKAATMAYNYVKGYKIAYTKDKWNVFEMYKEHSSIRVFIGPSATLAKSRVILTHPTSAFGIKIIPTSWNGKICMRMEINGYVDPEQPTMPTAPIEAPGCTRNKGCSGMVQPLGMESGAIPNNQITSSSYYSNVISKWYPHFGRLNGDKQWCDSRHTNELTEYLQVDLGKKMIIAGIATQGQTTFDNWTTKYKVEYAGSDLVFQFFPSNSAPVIFKGNSDRHGIVKNKFNPRIEARYIRVNPIEFHGNDICLRIELYGCQPL